MTPFPTDHSESRERDLVVTADVRIPRAEIQFTFSRSSGPGGQNVNKVNTKAQLRWNIRETSAISDDIRARFEERYHQRINSEGVVVLSSQRYRDQKRNVNDCLEKLSELVLSVVEVPKPRKVRSQRSSSAANAQRLKEKRARSERKRLRKRPTWND